MPSSNAPATHGGLTATPRSSSSVGTAASSTPGGGSHAGSGAQQVRGVTEHTSRPSSGGTRHP